MFEILVLLFGLFLLYQVFGFFRKGGSTVSNHLGIDGELLYADLGRGAKRFVSSRYGIMAKPDFILRLRDGQNAIAEYKDRGGRVYCSDVAQVKASALAVREEMPLQRAFVVTRNGPVEIPLNPDSKKLHAEIAEYIEWARRIRRKELIRVYAANPKQCDSCSLKRHCMKNA